MHIFAFLVGNLIALLLRDILALLLGHPATFLNGGVVAILPWDLLTLLFLNLLLSVSSHLSAFSLNETENCSL